MQHPAAAAAGLRRQPCLRPPRNAASNISTASRPMPPRRAGPQVRGCRRQPAERTLPRGDGAAVGCELERLLRAVHRRHSQQCGPLTSRSRRCAPILIGNQCRSRTAPNRLRPDRTPSALAILVAPRKTCGPSVPPLRRRCPRHHKKKKTPRSGFLFESLFGRPGAYPCAGQRRRRAGRCGSCTYKRVCVRTCDGFFYSIRSRSPPMRAASADADSLSRNPALRRGDCSLHRNPGEDIIMR